MIDDIQLYSIREMANFLLEQSDSYHKVLDLGKALILKKTTSDRSFGEWSNQPYIVRKTDSALPQADPVSDSALFETLDLDKVGLRRLVSSSLALFFARMTK
jgi:hypothetical protein